MSSTFVTSTLAEPVAAPQPFVNEPVADFTRGANREAIERALAQVRAQLGREYELLIAGRREKTGDLLKSLNPSKPSEVVGVHHKATAAQAREAVEAAHAYFPEWAATPAETALADIAAGRRAVSRAQVRVRRLAGLRSRQDLAGSRSRRFRSHRFLRVLRARDAAPGRPDPLVQLPGEQDEMLYLPLGVGVVVPPWNFPLAIMVGMTVAALVTGNTVVHQAFQRNAHHRREIRRSAARSRFPAAHRSRCWRAAARPWATCWWSIRKTRFISFTGSQRSRPAHQRTGGQAAARADLDQARDRRNGRQGRHHRGSRSRSRQAPWRACCGRRSATRDRSARPARAPSWTPPFTTSSSKS